eukprot:g26683.t1
MAVITDTDAKRNIAYHINATLAAQGQSRYWLAKATGEWNSTIANVCNGKNMPGAGLLARIATALDLPAGELLKPIPEQLDVAVRLMRRFRETVTSGLLSVELLVEFANWLRKPPAERRPRTVNNKLSAIGTLWAFAEERGVAPPRPKKLPRVKETKKLPRAWTLKEFRLMLHAAQNAPDRFGWGPCHWRALLLVLYDTALRISPAMKLEWSDVDLEQAIVTVPGERQKNDCETLHQLHPETVSALAALRTRDSRESQSGNAAYHSTRVFRWPWSYHWPQEKLTRYILQPAGLPTTRNRKFHCIRKTSASHLAAVAGDALATHHLGHLSPGMARASYIDPRIAMTQSSLAMQMRSRPRSSQANRVRPARKPPEYGNQVGIDDYGHRALTEADKLLDGYFADPQPGILEAWRGPEAGSFFRTDTHQRTESVMEVIGIAGAVLILGSLAAHVARDIARDVARDVARSAARDLAAGVRNGVTIRHDLGDAPEQLRELLGELRNVAEIAEIAGLTGNTGLTASSASSTGESPGPAQPAPTQPKPTPQLAHPGPAKQRPATVRVHKGEGLPYVCLCPGCHIGVFREVEFCDVHYPLVSEETLDRIGEILTMPEADREILAPQLTQLKLLAISEIGCRASRAFLEAIHGEIDRRAAGPDGRRGRRENTTAFIRPMEPRMSWVQTHKRKWFDLLDPRPDQVDIEDIAHALARLCRFNGHTNGFYSVAQHSVLCSQIVDPLYAFDALMHDAAEAYVGDLVSPVKRLLDDHGGHAFRDCEDRICRVIAYVFGNEYPVHPRVHEADATMLATEVQYHLGGPIRRTGTSGATDAAGYAHTWTQHMPDPIPLAESDIAGWGPLDAEAAFLKRFYELSGGPKDPLRDLAGAA